MSNVPFNPPISKLKSLNLWRSIRVLNLYQLALGLIFFLISYHRPDFLGLSSETQWIFSAVSLGYLTLALIGSLCIFYKKPDFNLLVIILSLGDITALSLLLHLYGGSGTGFGILLMVAIAGVSIIAEKTTSINLAALAVLAVLGQQIYSHLSSHQVNPAEYAHAGITGIGIFAAAMITNVLSQKLRSSEFLAEQRRQHLFQIQQLTEYVLQRMQTGVIVLNEDSKIVMINQSALTLLNLKTGTHGKNINEISAELDASLKGFQQTENHTPTAFKASNFSPTIIPRFVSLRASKTDPTTRTLIFLEDISATKQQAQQMKLLSLGKLSANIAHEVRNPLGAISHAAQLLSESYQLTSADQRLLHIIMEQSKRMNDIIEGILQISRGESSPPILMTLKEKLNGFKDAFSHHHELSVNDISINIAPENTKIRMNSGHFDQILWNLCGNALRYTQPKEGQAKIMIKGGISESLPGPYIDVIDFGKGINDEDIDHIFEPFFTLSPEGSGLGLYVSMELCEANQARIEYIDLPDIGSCFRIIFADPRRKQLS